MLRPRRKLTRSVMMRVFSACWSGDVLRSWPLSCGHEQRAAASMLQMPSSVAQLRTCRSLQAAEQACPQPDTQALTPTRQRSARLRSRFLPSSNCSRVISTPHCAHGPQTAGSTANYCCCKYLGIKRPTHILPTHPRAPGRGWRSAASPSPAACCTTKRPAGWPP